MNLRLIALIFVSLLITSCHTDVKEPKTELDPVSINEVWESLPVDEQSDEEFFKSLTPSPPN